MRTPSFAGYKSKANPVAVGATVVSAAIGMVALFVAMIIFSGFVLSQLWSWFVVTSLHAPEITLGDSLGLATVVGFFTSHLQGGNKAAFAYPLIALAWGALLHYVFGVGA